MGSMLRSDKMSFCEFYIQSEAAFESMLRIGNLCCVQFKDMNEESENMRKYISEICRCEEMSRRLRFVMNEMKKDNTNVPDITKIPPPLLPKDMENFETKLEAWETDLTEMSTSQTAIMQVYLELSELHYVLTHIGPVLGNAEIHLSQKPIAELRQEGHLQTLTGVVRREKSLAFQKMLWRVAKGNIFYREASEDRVLTDPTSRQGLRKIAFLVICQGETLKSRLLKVCSGFKVNLYPCPSTAPQRHDMARKLDNRLMDMDQVIKKTKFQRCKILFNIGTQYRSMYCAVKITRALYHHLNLFTVDITKKCLLGRGWVPDKDLNNVQEALRQSAKAASSRAPSLVTKIENDKTPPTYHRVNKFTRGFQNLINAYGDSTYGELNPGLYTVVTFPFLFAMMFGDIGHALIMLAFALFMVLNEKKFDAQNSTNEIWNIFYSGRYIMLLMSIFSIYTGFFYNDFFSKRMLLTSSQWLHEPITKESFEAIPLTKDVELDPKIHASQFAYYFGVDPYWGMAKNKIVVENSLKMKLSIIIGILHMLFGLTLSFFNHVYFKQYFKIALEFIPQIVFLCCLFAYLVFMMFFKWLTFSGLNTDDPKLGAGCAPLLLIYFIDMFLLKASKNPDPACNDYMYNGQRAVQLVLVIVALICIPIMLFGTPVYMTVMKIRERNKKKPKPGFRGYKYKDEDDEDHHGVGDEGHGHSFGELMTHQGVHTIEFVLSTISHTASYLRLWALSLAHSQLSEMLWTMILAKNGLQKPTSYGFIMTWLMFYAWAVLSISIMVLMEGLSAFLHTLRLHWVEFMSKFYQGEGYKFVPFCIKGICAVEDEDKPMAICAKLKKIH